MLEFCEVTILVYQQKLIWSAGMTTSQQTGIKLKLSPLIIKRYMFYLARSTMPKFSCKCLHVGIISNSPYNGEVFGVLQASISQNGQQHTCRYIRWFITNYYPHFFRLPNKCWAHLFNTPSIQNWISPRYFAYTHPRTTFSHQSQVSHVLPCSHGCIPNR